MTCSWSQGCLCQAGSCNGSPKSYASALISRSHPQNIPKLWYIKTWAQTKCWHWKSSGYSFWESVFNKNWKQISADPALLPQLALVAISLPSTRKSKDHLLNTSSLYSLLKSGISMLFTCLQVFPASDETNMLMSLSDNSAPMLPARRTLFSDSAFSDVGKLANSMG